jgi:hypothetical protein
VIHEQDEFEITFSAPDGADIVYARLDVIAKFGESYEYKWSDEYECWIINYPFGIHNSYGKYIKFGKTIRSIDNPLFFRLLDRLTNLRELLRL